MFHRREQKFTTEGTEVTEAIAAEFFDRMNRMDGMKRTDPISIA
jgi:hypothetical protein